MFEPRSILWRAHFAFLALLLAGPVQAATAGTLQGRVLDPQGRAVSGAHVTVEKEGAAVHREATTDAAGGFTLPELPPGSYTLVAQAQGFAPRTHKGLTLAVGQSYRLDVGLEVGTVSESVEAVAEAPLLVKAGSSTVDTVIGSTAIERLPLNGRNFLELAFLVPGNVPTPNFDPTKTNTMVVASAGQFGRGGMITIDGADNNDDVVGGPLQNIPQDAVQEFQIATNRYTAESGRSAAAAINVVTRSGNDTLQGTASFFLRDKSLQALPATHDRPARFDWSPSGNDRVTLRYAFESADDTGASTLDRSIGSACPSTKGCAERVS